MNYLMVLLLIGSMAAPGRSTTLSDAAAIMKSNSWRPLLAGGTAHFTTSNGVGNMPIFVWANKGCWDPVTKQILFMGCPHQMPVNFVIYDEASNLWRDEVVPTEGNPTMGHAYDANAMDDSGNYYHLYPVGDAPLWKYNTQTRIWSRVPEAGAKPVTSYGTSLNYFPEMHSLILTYGTVSRFDLRTNTWQSLGSVPMGAPHNLSAYDPVHHCMILGGGNNSGQMYKLDSTGVLTALKPAPFFLAVGGLTCDPVTGTFLYLNDSLRALDMETEEWHALCKTPFTQPSNAYVACPIRDYGVIAYVGVGQYSCLLYKYAQTGSKAESPSVAPGAAKSGLSCSPNPFNPAVTLRLSGALEKGASVKVFDLSGGLVADLTGKMRGNSASWNASGRAAGVYLAVARKGNLAATERIVFSR